MPTPAVANERERLGKYMETRELPSQPGRKTQRWGIYSAKHGSRLGEVRWHGPWRQYCFFPEDALFNVGCLQEIATFLHRKMEARRAA